MPLDQLVKKLAHFKKNSNEKACISKKKVIKGKADEHEACAVSSRSIRARHQQTTTQLTQHAYNADSSDALSLILRLFPPSILMPKNRYILA